LTNSFVKTIGVKQLSAILNYRRHLQKDDVYHPLGIFSKLTNSFIKIIGVKQLSAILNYRRHLQKNGVYHPLGIFSKVTNSFVKTIGVKQLSAILNYRRYLQKDGVYSLGLSSGIDRIFLAISLLISAPYEFFKPLIILQTTPNVKFNYLKPINCWFYFIFSVFVYKMAIIHLEFSRNWRILRTNSFVRTIGVNQLSAILNYRRHFAEEMI
jgi:hypothetical protein